MRVYFSLIKVLISVTVFYVLGSSLYSNDIEIDLGNSTTSTSVEKNTSTPTPLPASKPTLEKPNPTVSITTNESFEAEKPVGTGSIVSKVEFSSEGSGTQVTIDGNNLIKPSVERISNQKILLKFSKTSLKIPSTIRGKGNYVKTVRSSAHPGAAWIVIDLKKSTKWHLQPTEKGFALLINVNQESSKNTIETTLSSPVETTNPTNEKGLFAQLTDASLRPMDNGIKLVLTTDVPTKYTVRKLSQPEKIILHFQNTKLVLSDINRKYKFDDLAFQKGGLLSIEFRQIPPTFSPIAETILTILPGTTYQLDRDINQVVITLTAPPVIQKSVEKKGNLNQLITMDLESADLNAVIKTLVDESGYVLDLPGGPLTGTINEKFKDVPLKTVLADLLAPNNYNYEIQGNTLRVGTLASITGPKALQQRITELIAPTGGMTPPQFDTMVRPLLNPTNALPNPSPVDTVRNMLVLTGTPTDIEDYKRAIRDLKLDSSTESDRITRVVKLNYSDPTQLSTILQPYLTPVGKIQVSGYQIVIWETATNMGTLLELINELDRKPPQVLIESNIVEVTNEADLNLGVQWTINKNSGDPTLIGATGTGMTTFGDINFGTVKAGVNINATLEMLQTNKKAKIISRPRIATTNGVQAEINEIENFVSTQNTVVFSNGAQQTTTNFITVPLPIDLKVTPRITDEGTITTDIIASITSITATVQGSNGTIPPPQTSVQTATTKINTKNGETIVIGGLVRETSVETVNGIPILSSIPIIGTLFQEKQRSNQTEELVIFITPTLLED